jgi:hypothetical protein
MEATPPPPVKQHCHTCKFGTDYECRRHAPVYDPADTTMPKWPVIYFRGHGAWCGDWEPKINS